MILAIALLAAQVPLTPGKNVNLTWQASNCGAVCGYFVSRVTVASTATKCPASGYTPLNFGDPVMTPAFTDYTATNLKVCYVVQQEFNNVPSKPSAPVGPFTVP